MSNKIGRPKVEMTDEFIEVWKKWKRGNYKSTVSAIADSKLARSTFYKFSKIMEQQDINK